MYGKFITFEGGEGTGKSTQAGLLAHKLEALGLGVLLTREPGGSPGAEIIRHVLLSGAAKPLGADAEGFQAKRQHRRLGRLAGALAAFEGDEFAAHVRRPMPKGAILSRKRFVQSKACRHYPT